MWKRVNVKPTILVCAFCKHWYDPANSHIKPHDIFFNQWEYETDVKSYCCIWKHDKRSQDFCSRYECKL